VLSKGKSRIELKVDVLCEGELACVMNATYAIVALKDASPQAEPASSGV